MAWITNGLDLGMIYDRPMTVPHILIVDDDPHIREVISFALRQASFTTTEAADGALALEAFRQQPASLVVLDILMPEMDGAQVCRELRSPRSPAPAVPIVFLSSKDDEVDRVLGLEMGGDDYITKPFSPRELVARVRAVLRRSNPAPPDTGPQGLRQHGLLKVDDDRFEAWWGDTALTLTVTEFGILSTLLGRPGKVFTRDELMHGAYRDHTIVSDRTINSHVKRLRRKLAAAGGEPIETVHGLGYRLAAQE